MRTLQYIFNVLMSNGVIKLEHNDNGDKYWYSIEKTDPFYITDEDFAEMERNFNEEYPEKRPNTTGSNMDTSNS